MEIYQWILLYVAVSLGFGGLWVVAGPAAVINTVRFALWPLVVIGMVWLLAGCVVASPPRIAKTDLGPRVSLNACYVGDGPNDALVKEADSLGIDLAMRPLPDAEWIPDIDYAKTHEYDDGARERAAIWFAKSIPECPLVVYYVGDGAGTSCGVGLFFGAPCEMGFTYARRNRMDAVMIIRMKTPSIVAHEFYHALGCDHGNEGETCRAQIAYMKAQL